MDQDESDAKISLRTYADQLCPEEAVALKHFIPKGTGLAMAPTSWVRSSLDGHFISNRTGLAAGPTPSLVRLLLRAMAKALVNDAADGRSEILDGVKLPASIFIIDPAEASALIEQALKQDDMQVRLSGRGLKSRAGGANAVDDTLLLKKVEKGVQTGLTPRKPILRNLSSNMTEQEQDTVVHRIQRKRRQGRKS